MILKLLKYELKHMWKIKCAAFVMLFLSGTLFAVLIQLLNTLFGEVGVSIAAIITTFGYLFYMQLAVIILAGIAILCIVRFTNAFVGKEAYLMHTLPVSIHSRLAAHIAATLIWLFGAAAAIVVSDLVMNLISQDFIGGVAGFFLETFFFEANESLEILRNAVMVIYLCLHLYACISVGFSFSRGKVGVSVAMFALTAFVELGIVLLIMPTLNQKLTWLTYNIDTICFCSLFGALYYFLTVYFLKNELNVE